MKRLLKSPFFAPDSWAKNDKKALSKLEKICYGSLRYEKSAVVMVVPLKQGLKHKSDPLSVTVTMLVNVALSVPSVDLTNPSRYSPAVLDTWT